ncbi:hypothetical protein MIND_00862200 [Mycena indigotica]|uniref:Uncharacterized protein n=1 Tax=Mycena indigotica TaxID=2126181 RepID=A0A8H6SHU4_9AGAR|nr:uncharacterized protein MIND_00862200 [Mycena indigotica]KAF7299137.1 hypothetical protein MIND_00862200 [Mycena indigotica]
MSYSSFFISGLLSPASSAPTSERRSSLPVSGHSRTPSEVSHFYFTPTRDDYRSFLSLDLAHRRSIGPFSFDSVMVPDSPTVPPSPRILPSAKPAPMTSLPSLPDNNNLDVLNPSLSRSPTPVQRKPSVASQATRASATSSTVSTHYRRTRRDRALERLEGKRPVKPKFEVTGNFISLSEDEDEDQILPADEEIDLSLTNDQLAMLIDNPYYVPTPPASAEPPKRARRKTVLGLQSFMDFRNDDDSNSRWSWRSFIEIAT